MDSHHKVSVILCAHNPRRAFIERAIRSLAAQTLDQDLWEFCLIDNASNPHLDDPKLINWHKRGRIIREPNVGLTNARLRGIKETNGRILVFVDDDNLLSPDYLETATLLSEKFTFLGAFGGSCFPEFELPPPDWTERYWGCLAIRTIHSDRWSNRPRDVSCLPVGAGMCVRREVAERYHERVSGDDSRRDLDRSGNILLSCGDHDLAETSCELGLGFGVLTGLYLTHIIPPARLTREYLERLMEGIYFSGVTLDGLHGILPLRKRDFLNKLADLVRVIRAGKNHRRILAACYRGRNRAENEVFANHSKTKSAK